VKHLHGRSGHPDVAVISPVEFQVAAGQVGEDFSRGAAAQRAGHADRGKAPVPQASVIPLPRSMSA